VAFGCFFEQSAELEVRLLLGLDGGLERISRRVIGSNRGPAVYEKHGRMHHVRYLHK
jgi:hypothetical protein